MDSAAAIKLASESIALCAKVITELKKFAEAKKHLESLIKNVERVRQSCELLLTAVTDISKAGYGDLTRILRPCAEELPPLIDDILARGSGVVADQPDLGIIRRLQWTLTKSETKDLVDGVKRVKERIHQNQVQDTEARLASRPALQDSFLIDEWAIVNPRPVVVDDDLQINADEDQKTNGPQRPMLWTWLGYCITTGHDLEYLDHRNALSDAAHRGEWGALFRIIELGQTRYGESWVNARRIRKPNRPRGRSGWAPIHEAVRLRAPLEVFERLIAIGASRTLRTKHTKLTWSNMSALELALEFDVHWAIDILRPVICLPVPRTTLQTLQDKFHALILREIEVTGVDSAWLDLPVLEVLTEYESGSTWYPIRLEEGSLYVMELPATIIM